MGNDGGSIPKRRELVKEAARLPTASELKATALESQAHAWSTCPISSEVLDPHNAVSDFRGRLYNYETVLRCLMPSADASSKEQQQQPSQEAAEFARSGIRSLKDVVKLRFCVRRDETRGGGGGGGEIRICPLSLKELGAGVRMVYLVPCGHVFSEIVMKELLTADGWNGDPASEQTGHCTQCDEAFVMRDMLPLLPVEDADLDRCVARLERLRSLGLAHNLKKDKSAGKKKRKATEESKTADEKKTDGDREKKQKRDRDGISSRINNSMTATLTAKVLAEQDERNRQRKLAAAMR